MNRQTLDKRRIEVEGLMVLQIDYAKIQRDVAGKYECTTRTVRSDIAAIHKKWQEDSIFERPALQDKMRRSLRRILHKALAKGDLKNALGALDRLAKVDGLYAPVEAVINHTGTVEAKMSKMTSDDKRKRLDNLMEQYAPAKGNGQAVIN